MKVHLTVFTLVLTTAFLADRNKTLYGGQVTPDVMAETDVVEAAIAWLEE